MPVTADSPTLGWYLRQPGVAERIERIRAGARWRMRAGLAEQAARGKAARKVADLHGSLLLGRRLDRIAAELRLVAEDLERTPYQLAHDDVLLEVA